MTCEAWADVAMIDAVIIQATLFRCLFNAIYPLSRSAVEKMISYNTFVSLTTW